MPGTVHKIIPPPRPSQQEQAQIGVWGADSQKQDLRIENTLTDEHSDDVKLKKGAYAEITSQWNQRHQPPQLTKIVNQTFESQLLLANSCGCSPTSVTAVVNLLV